MFSLINQIISALLITNKNWDNDLKDKSGYLETAIYSM
jgi:hypothetical protein